MPNHNKVFLFLFLFNQLSEYDLDCLCSRSYFNSEKCNFPDGIRSRDISVASQTNALPRELMEISTDAKWNIHIENILWSFYKHLNVLRKLKYKLSRKNLEKLYLVYIRSIFEYVVKNGIIVVWEILINLISCNLRLLESLLVFQYLLVPF